MYATDEHIQGFSSWMQYVIHRGGSRTILQMGVLVGSLVGFINPTNAIEVIDVVWSMAAGHLPPELIQARWFFEGALESTGPFEVVMAPNHEEIEVLSVCLMETAESLLRDWTRELLRLQ
ncbi:uncharacterized protein LOC130666739 [Microplitis mediator]|uniref:uncharacterized protein LOC130663034 n=1 Tax=Microplitis mediator TaxID=375433 RepID=UPI002553E029|nr:uncharacterized protein LOC130663034 [Microplitis mediator]XP_057323961.1 uncharacterized protein LOC130666739 [Microplitis mediator]